MTLADEARLATPFEHLRTAIEFATGIVGHAIGRRWFQTCSPELREPGGVPFDDP